jgi:hypothetical protein
MVTWLTRQQVAVRWVNRAQNTSILTLCDVITAHCVKVRRFNLKLHFGNVTQHLLTLEMEAFFALKVLTSGQFLQL